VNVQVPGGPGCVVVTTVTDVAPVHEIRGRREDLDEMLGNLLDNACKWARFRVTVSASVEGAQLAIVVDDDGPGLEPSLRAQVLQRGVRADQQRGMGAGPGDRSRPGGAARRLGGVGDVAPPAAIHLPNCAVRVTEAERLVDNGRRDTPRSPAASGRNDYLSFAAQDSLGLEDHELLHVQLRWRCRHIAERGDLDRISVD
jgi:hypothetical protein